MSKKTPKTDYAYCAGIVDGEGCIRIIKCANKDRHAGFEWQLNVCISNTSLRILNKLVGVFGGHVYSRDRQFSRYRQYVWNLYGKKACEMLKKIKPYLKEKKEQADLGIKFNIFLSQRTLRKATKKLTEQEIQERDRYYFKMRELKKEFLTPVAPAETNRIGTNDFPGEVIVQPN